MPPPAHILNDRLRRARAAAVTDRHEGMLVTSPLHLRYLFGVDASAGAALLHERGAELVVDGRYAEAFANAAGLFPDVRVHVVGRQATVDATIGHVVAALALATLAVEAEHVTVARLAALVAGLQGTAVVETQGLLEDLRVIKDGWELDRLREAGRRLSTVAACILPRVSAGLTERQVAWQVEVALHDAGFDGLAFAPIVASGPHSARPHHRPTDRRIEEGDLVVVDFGGTLDGYAVDMTRTVAVGHVGAEAEEWLEAVGAAARAGVAMVAAGRLPSAVDQAARAVLEAKGLGEAFVHSTGHGLGLAVHERPWIAPRGDADGPLAAGMVFTVEPGVYLAGRGGVRLEDDVVVTAHGHERLTDAPPPFDHHER